MTTAGLACRPGGVRRLGRAVHGAALSGACLAGVAAAGAVVSSRATYPRPCQDAPGRAAARVAPAGRIVVAVVLGPRGSVGTDALGPYEVFARSPAFFAYTASPGRAVSVLSGGLALVPEHSLEDVDAGLVTEPDVVVVPAVAGPAAKELAPLRDWIARRAGREAHILGVCAGSVLLAAAGLLDGRRATSHWSNIASLRRKHPQVEWVRGQRYVVDGPITTTGGVTSGIFGALRLVGQLAGTAEAERVGRELAYPGWHRDTRRLARAASGTGRSVVRAYGGLPVVPPDRGHRAGQRRRRDRCRRGVRHLCRKLACRPRRPDRRRVHCHDPPRAATPRATGRPRRTPRRQARRARAPAHVRG